MGTVSASTTWVVDANTSAQFRHTKTRRRPALTLPLGVVRDRLELRVVLLERVQVRLQLLHRLLVRALLLARLRELVLEVRDRVRLLLHGLHPALHQLDLHARLLDRLVLELERARERLDLVVQLRDLALCLDVDRRRRLDLVDT